MSLESDILARLTGFAALTNIVADRIYNIQIPPDMSLPAVAFRKISSSYTRSFGGHTGDEHARFQINCESPHDDPEKAAGARDAVIEAMKDYSGGGIRDTSIESSRSGYSPDGRKYIETVDVMIWYRG